MLFDTLHRKFLCLMLPLTNHSEKDGTDSATRQRLQRIWRDWRGFVLFIAVMVVFRSAIADWNQVPSGSMKPSILVGDRIVVDKLAYDLRIPFTHDPNRALGANRIAATW